VIALAAALWAAPAGAGERLLSVGEAAELGLSSGFLRTAPQGDERWSVFYGVGGNYHRVEVNRSLEVITPPRQLTEINYLIDHAIAPCPGGGWLHAGSVLTEEGSGAIATRLDDALEVTATRWISQGHPTIRYNDLLVHCGPSFQGAAAMDFPDHRTIFIPIGEDAAPGEALAIASALSNHGAAMVAERDGGLVLVSATDDHRLHFSRLDPATGEPVEIWSAPVVPRHLKVFWPQGAIAVGDHFVVAHVARDESSTWYQDTGNIWLQIFDRDWLLVESHRITSRPGGVGYMRPSLSHREDQLLLSYDSDMQGVLRMIRIDAAAFGVGE